MAGIGSVVVQFMASDKLSGTVDGITRKLRGMDDETGKAKSSFGKLSAAWAASIPIAGAVVAGVVGLANGLIEAGKAALEDKNSADKLAHTLSNIKGITDDAIAANEEWISSMQLATLVSDTDLRNAVSKLALATGDLEEAQKLATIAIDAASGSGKSLDSVTTALAKAQDGNTAALKRMFPWLDKNKDGTVTLAEATEGLTGKFKGNAAEAQKTKPWETLTVIFGELKEEIGKWLLPVMEKFSDWFKDPVNQEKIRRFLDRVGELALSLGEDLVGAIDSAVTWLKKPENQKKIKEWTEMFGDMARAIGSTISFIRNLIEWMKKIPANPVGKIIDIANPFNNSAAAPNAATRAARTTTAAPTSTYQPNVMVTEEQVYRAVSQLLLRGDARNGRAVRLA